MSGYTRQVQTKLSDQSFYMLEELAHTRGVTVSELLRDLVERELGQPVHVTAVERIAIETLTELHAIAVELHRIASTTVPYGHGRPLTDILRSVRGEGERRIREAAARERTKQC